MKSSSFYRLEQAGQAGVFQAVKSASSYRAELRAAVRALWAGHVDETGFFEMMREAIDREFEKAWREGMRQAGLNPKDITQQERELLEAAKVQERAHVYKFMKTISENSKAAGGKLTPLRLRVERWLVRYSELVSFALQQAQNDPPLKWIVTARESCSSCLKLAGKVKRASAWRAADIRPQHPRLLRCMIEARGVPVCKCYFEKTDEPLSPGRLPGLP